MTIESTLRHLGLNDKEIKVYTALLKNGKTIPSTLSKLTKINRASVYSSAKSLVAKGIIAEDLSGKTLYLVPLPIEQLKQLVEKPRRDLEEKEQLISRAISDLSLLVPDKSYPVPKIRFVEEQNLENFLYENFTKWQDEILKTDSIWWGFQDHSFVEQYEKWIMWTWNLPEYKTADRKVRILSNHSNIENKMSAKVERSKRDIRFVPGMNFTSSMWVAGDYLVMTATRQHPFYLFEIHDATLAHNMREVFKKLWSTTENK